MNNKMPMHQIRIGERTRRDFGDIDALAESIASIGLLHPIVVTEEGVLVAGERRFRAVGLLGWPDIPVNVVDIDAIVVGEMDENVVRKDFTPSERVEIGKRVEDEIGNRQGQRTDKELVQNFAQVDAGTKTRDEAARKAGFGNAETFRQAKIVVEHGAPELVEAMDKGEVSISAAADVAILPKEQQAEIVARGEDEIIREANRLRREKKEKKKAEREAAKVAVPEDLPRASDRFTLLHADIRGMDIPEGSVDCIITDPPYPEEYLECFTWLADAASRWLKPGGTLAVMSGQVWLPRVFEKLCSNPALNYRWTMSYLTPGGQAVQVFPRKVNTFWKPIILLQKVGPDGSEWIGDVCKSDANDNDKRFHHWGQSESGIADLVDRLTMPGDVICDPFLGGGTTAVVAVTMNRVFIGGDLDASNVKISAARLSEVSDAA